MAKVTVEIYDDEGNIVGELPYGTNGITGTNLLLQKPIISMDKRCSSRLQPFQRADSARADTSYRSDHRKR